MTDATIQEALARAKAPVEVTFSERWLLNVAIDALTESLAKNEALLRRSKHESTRRVLTQRLEGLRQAHHDLVLARGL